MLLDLTALHCYIALLEAYDELPEYEPQDDSDYWAAQEYYGHDTDTHWNPSYPH